MSLSPERMPREPTLTVIVHQFNQENQNQSGTWWSEVVVPTIVVFCWVTCILVFTDASICDEDIGSKLLATSFDLLFACFGWVFKAIDLILETNINTCAQCYVNILAETIALMSERMGNVTCSIFSNK